jgi:homoserine kinase
VIFFLKNLYEDSAIFGHILQIIALMKNTGIKVFAPASVGNVIVGFDIMGLALERPGDEVLVRFSHKPGLRIRQITGAKGRIPYDIEKNTAGVSAQRFLEHIGEADRGIDMEIRKKMPFASGLGSSAASAVAGVFAVNELLKRPLQKRELLQFAVQGEQVASGALHADNVAPSLLGGIVFIRSNKDLDVHRLPVPRGTFATVIHPKIEIKTADSRALLGDQVPLKTVVQQSGNLGGFIIGLHRSDFDLIGRSLQDLIIEPQRAKLIPGFYQVQEAALNEGALGCSISGAGPSIFALSANSLIAENVGIAMKKVFHDLKIKSEVFVSQVNQEGAIKY